MYVIVTLKVHAVLGDSVFIVCVYIWSRKEVFKNGKNSYQRGDKTTAY